VSARVFCTHCHACKKQDTTRSQSLDSVSPNSWRFIAGGESKIGAGQQLRTTVPIAHRLYEVLKLIQQVLAQHFVVLGIGNAAPKLAK